MAKHDAASRRSASAVPGLATWNTYGGGTGAVHDKSSYDYYTAAIAEGGRQYSISPYTTERGRHAGYLLSVFPGEHGHSGINSEGSHVMFNSPASSFRRPQTAASAARKHAAKYGATTGYKPSI